MQGRIELIDALRAVALFGILQVNIQSFLWGGGEPLGYFPTPPGPLETALYLAVGTFVSLKFLSLFALLFGFGFALQMRGLRRRYGLEEGKARYRRRLGFLLAVGVLHGTLLYYGDILTAYALCGFVLVGYADARPARLLAATRRFWVAHLVLTAAFVLLADRSGQVADAAAAQRLPHELFDRFAVMVAGGFGEQLTWRVPDYLAQQSSVLLTSVPFIVGLFTLGALAARLGWLTRPRRHPRVWRAARALGAVGLALSALGTWFDYRGALESPGDPGMLGYTLMNLGFPALALYLAWVVHRQDRAWMRTAVAWLAPAGRMPLTNYLMQSLLMGALLSGWGLGWGRFAGRAELALLALLIVAVQIVASRWWIGHMGQGPVEALWRRVTYA